MEGTRFALIEAVLGVLCLLAVRPTVRHPRLFVLVGLPLLVFGSLALATAVLAQAGLIDAPSGR